MANIEKSGLKYTIIYVSILLRRFKRLAVDNYVFSSAYRDMQDALTVIHERLGARKTKLFAKQLFKSILLIGRVNADR